MKQVKLQITLDDFNQAKFPPDNTTVFFRAWFNDKNLVWTIGRRFKPSGGKKVIWQDYSMGYIFEDSFVAEWSLIPELMNKELNTIADTSLKDGLDKLIKYQQVSSQ